MSKLIAIVGLPGSGKSEVVKELEKAGFAKVYFGGLTIEKLVEEKQPVNEESERKMREKLRQEHGMAAYVILNLPKIKEALTCQSVVIDGLYSWEEYLVLREEYPELLTVAVYASPKTRSDRLATRPIRPLTPEKTKSRDYAQIENLHQAGPIAMADYTIVNEGDLASVKEQVKLILDAQR